jgi:hypothetical protein
MKVTRKLSFIALGMASIAATGLLAAPAGAAVNPTSLAYTHPATTAIPCSVTVGDMKAWDSVGAVDVSCAGNHTISTVVYLYRSTTSPTSGYSIVGSSNVLTNYGRNQSNWTNGSCGSGYWFTMAHVSIDGRPWSAALDSWRSSWYGQC